MDLHIQIITWLLRPPCILIPIGVELDLKKVKLLPLGETVSVSRWLKFCTLRERKTFVNRKYLCLFALLISVLNLQGQDNFQATLVDCIDWVQLKTDSAGKETLTAKSETFVSDDGKTGLNIYSFLNSTKKVVVVSIQAIGAGKCVDKGDKIIIAFEDGEQLTLANTNDFNCDGSSTIYFGGALGKSDEIKLLASKRITTMTVWTRDSNMFKTFSTDNSIKFQETIRCLFSAIIE
jgi:hypothetical protein